MKRTIYRLKENSHSTHVNISSAECSAHVFFLLRKLYKLLKMLFSSRGKEGNVAVQLTYPTGQICYQELKCFG